MLDLSFGEAVPGISGTLAFDQLDLRSFLAAFTPFTPGSDSAPGAVDVAFAEKYNLDIRLSAAKATAGDFSFSDVAATAQVKGDLTAFDISDATIFGGTVQAGLRYDRKGERRQTSRCGCWPATSIAAAAAALAKSMRVVPAGKATASLMLRGPGRDWDSFLETAEGSFSASLGQGSAQRLRSRRIPRPFQAGRLLPAARGFERDGADRPCRSPRDARRRRGPHREGRGQDRRARDRAVRRHSLCRRRAGAVGRGRPPRAASGDATTAEASFFVGGSWSAPFVSPIFNGTSFDRPRWARTTILGRSTPTMPRSAAVARVGRVFNFLSALFKLAVVSLITGALSAMTCRPRSWRSRADAGSCSRFRARMQWAIPNIVRIDGHPAAGPVYLLRLRAAC